MNENTQRVSTLDKDIVYIKELASPTPQSITEEAREVARLTKDLEHYFILVEFPGMAIPSADVRHRVTEETRPLMAKLRHVAIATPGNAFLRVAIRFIARSSGFEHISIHANRDEALAHIRSVKGVL
jgi:hypothetical protein